MFPFIALHWHCIFYKLKDCGNFASNLLMQFFQHLLTSCLCHSLVIQLFHYYHIWYGDLWWMIFDVTTTNCFPHGSDNKESTCGLRETWVQSLGWEDPLEEGMATHSSILAWGSPWTEEPGGLQSKGSQRVSHDWETKHSTAAGAATKSLPSCPTLCDPTDGSNQAPPSGFSRQEHWSGLPFPSPMHEREKWKWSRSVMSNS